MAFHTLGCKLNFAETAALGKQFTEKGFTVVPFGDRADVCVINTCSVTERADRECRQIVRRALSGSPDAYIVVIGCYAQLKPTEISALPGVDLILGTKEKFNIFSYAGEFLKRDRPGISVSPIKESLTVSPADSGGFGERTRAFLKIQDGCDYVCSFCTIPLARGESRSAASDDILRQARTLVMQGYKELVLTGVNTGDYGRKNSSSLLDLLGRLVRIEGLQRLRISSIEPNLLSDELIDFWVSEPILCNHWHLPLQSGSDSILKGMRRRYTTSWYRSRIERIHSLVPDAGIGADVIVGFPGETEELFSETYSFIRDLPLTYLHVFSYSKRPQTHALGLQGHIEPRIIAERSERLRSLSLRKRMEFGRSNVGNRRPVLFETSDETGMATGLTEQYLRVVVPSLINLENEIRPVQITDVRDDGSVVGMIAEYESIQCVA